MRTIRLLCVTLLCLALLSVESFSQRRNRKQSNTGISYDSSLFNAMEFRLVGPFRGGRATAVAGVVQDPMTYYMGATGGVWKTDNAGESWYNVSDGFMKTASVGAIAVSESDPNVVYVGMGEAPVRGVMTSHGDGVYKSTDAGKTWKHMGLEKTRQISKIVVDPRNPEILIVGAQGSPYAATEDRGIYRSEDGGESWTKVHYVDENSGVSDLSMDMTNPRVVYAAYWDHRRFPWKVQSGGPGSGIWKSVDGGITWNKLTEGLPKGVMGKIGVSVSRANPNKVWAIIEADNGGLYRSDNGGKSWRLINPDRLLRARSWYYMHIQAHPTDDESVFVMNAPLVQSTDNGKTFVNLNTPHGDNHQIWVNPVHSEYMINANDGGANVSIDGGKNWSTQNNQPTAQFYRVNVDNQFPYRIYGGQQDNSSVSIASRVDGGGISNEDFFPVGGCESAYSAFDPDDPKYVYSGCYQGIIDEWNAKTKQTKDVMAYPFQGLGTNPADVKYRFNWNAPIVASKHDPSVIYHAGNKLLKTSNRGITWEEISPDLTKNDSTHISWGGGPITNEGAGGEIYHAIYYVAESPHTPDVIYTGADDGLLHITKDGGASWSNISMPNVEEGMVNQIEVSPHTPGTVYVAYNRYKYNDFTPHIFKSTDYGQTWNRLVSGIDADAHVRVVREDPNQKDLLYAGTETGLYVSFDGGLMWNKFQQNLPIVPITDLMIKDNDMIVATQGRAFWVMDDLNPLYELAKAKDSDFYVFEPENAIRDNAFRTGSTSMGQNPYPGFSIMYYLKENVDSVNLTVDFKDAQGNVVRHFSSSADKNQEKLRKKSGMNRLNWNLSMTNPEGVEGVFMGLGAGGHRVAPGQYTVEATYGNQTITKQVKVLSDPRWEATQAQYAEQQRLLSSLRAQIDELQEMASDIRSVRSQVTDLKTRVDENEYAKVHELADALIAEIDGLEEKLIQPNQKTFQDVINFPNKVEAQLLHIYGTIDGIQPPVTNGQKKRAADVISEAKAAMAKANDVNRKLEELMEYLRVEKVPFIAPKKKK
ncbi:MAG: glycosyl hydrolase [Roseivirga sp.]|uniref:VPS10 domain-containing protein n=1 Tax=Roseivirga sp. TaxID=1964215 RepID=UPI001B080FDA|nr:glycosyl hydrolase [Roseivirga sp.]MBO6660881.1 glycosyl hydrolase [Roseivirga sp.]MBO6909135.1 glycosyl hydrolase [Roseivirga sp.]